LVRINEYLRKHGIYPKSFRDFEKDLKKNFKKKRELISLKRIREATGKHPEQIKKYLSAMEELGRIRKCPAYFLGCSITELIVVDFGFGDMALCPTCNSEILLPSEGDEVVCDCGIHYVRQFSSRWVYKPRIRYLGEGEWEVESFSAPGEFYTVSTFERSCSCPHHLYRGAYCKHMKQIASLVASLIFNETMNVPKPVSNKDLAVITAVIRRWFDPRDYMRTVTYRELQNEVEKISGLKLTTPRIGRIISKFEEKGVLKRTHDPRQGVGHKTLITVNQWALRLFLKLGKEKISNTLHEGIITEPPGEENCFLKLDRVVHSDVVLPYMGFTVGAHVNYRFSKPTDIRLNVLVEENKKVIGFLMLRLNGEGVLPFSLTPSPPGEKVWKLKLELYQLCKVESFSKPGKFYDVDVLENWCSCPDHLYNHNHCKHLRAMEKIIETLQEDLTQKESLITQESQMLQNVTLKH